jgi:MinD superfamily P-loop ATPase
MVHARLGVAEENSGKLVTTVRREAKRVAEEIGREMVIIDGSPGIGCPVIASITGATAVLVVTEPTLSGLHDLDRVVDLTSHFRIPTSICINKSDINPEMTERIRNRARERGIQVLGEIPYDPDVTRAQIAGISVVEHNDGPAATAIRALWEAVTDHLPVPAGLIQLQTKG